MVWSAPEAVDDSALDSVRAKPLKKRCSSRAGLSRYYSSKSQSFSSLDLVQCTPFGTSALALAKRPSSFDLRRSSPRAAPGGGPGGGLSSHGPSSGLRRSAACCADDLSYMNANEEEGEAAEGGSHGSPDQCPCNDTIFADPADAFMSPEGSPSASPLQLYDSCSLSGAGMVPYQQQRQFQLTNEYLTHLSVLLPLQQASASSGGGGGGGCGSGAGSLSHAFSGSFRSASSCGSGCFSQMAGYSSGSGCSSAAPSRSDSCAMAAAARLWQSAAAHLAASCDSSGGGGGGGVCCCSGADGGSCFASDSGPQQQHHHQQQQHERAFSGPAPDSDTATAALLQSCSGDLRGLGGAGTTCSRLSNGGCAGNNAAAQQSFARQSACAGGCGCAGGCLTCNRTRNCLSAGGFLPPASSCGGFPHGGCAGAAAAAAATMGAAAVPTTAAPSRAAAAAAAFANCGGSSLGRRLGPAHRRLRATQAVAGSGGFLHTGHDTAAAGCWGSAEDMIAALTLSDQQQQHRRRGAQPSRQAGARGLGVSGAAGSSGSARVGAAAPLALAVVGAPSGSGSPGSCSPADELSVGPSGSRHLQQHLQHLQQQ